MFSGVCQRHLCAHACEWARQDLNLQPMDYESTALTRLSYGPVFRFSIIADFDVEPATLIVAQRFSVGQTVNSKAASGATI